MVLPLALVVGCGNDAPRPTVAEVVRGAVTTTVTGTGALQAISQQKLGFPDGGRVTEIDVAVGQRVVPGQPLAKVDNTAQLVALRKAKDEVARQQDLLDQITHGNQDSGGRSELGDYRDLLDSAQRTRDETDRADAAAVDQAQRQLDFDQDDRDRQLRILRFDRERCPNYPSRVGSAQDSGGVVGTNNDDPCDRYEDRMDRVADARRRIVADQMQIDAARKKRNLDGAQQRTVIDSAERDVTVARDKAGLAGSDKRFTGDAQAAVLDKARADLITAQQAFDATVMRSSFNGIVGSISGGVGKVLRAAFTRAAPGDPSAAASASEGGGDPAVAGSALPATAGSGAPATGPATGPETLITLNDTPSFQLLVPFSQADAARIKPNQPTEVTVEEVPGLTLTATVSAIAPTQAGQGETNYLATVVVTQSDPRLKDGMTAKAHVIVNSLPGVLMVPTAAVHGIGPSSTVSLIGADDSRREVPVQIGTVGDPTSEVTSGLKTGDRVLVPRPAGT